MWIKLLFLLKNIKLFGAYCFRFSLIYLNGLKIINIRKQQYYILHIEYSNTIYCKYNSQDYEASGHNVT